MASAYSILHNYRQETYGPNYQLMAAALQYKQNALDTNKMRIQSVYNQLGMLDIAKGQDQEYVEKRLESARDIINKYQGIDLSDKSIADSMISKLSEVVDEPTKNAVLSTKLYRSEQAEWEKMKIDKPDLYSDLNRSYAMRGANAWLSDGQVGTKYRGGGGFIAFSDVNAKLTKDLPKALETKGIEFKELSPGSGYFRDVITKKRISQGQVQEAINTILNEQDKRQLKINAWGQYDQMPDSMLESSYDDYYAPKIEQLKDGIKSLETTIAKTPDSSPLKAARQEQLESLRSTLESYESNDFASLSKKVGREGAYNTLYNDKFMSSFMNTYSVDVVTDIETYDNDVKTRDYEMKIKNYELNLRKQEFEEAKEIAKQRAAEEKAKGNSFSDPNYVKPMEGEKLELDYLSKESAISRHMEREANIVNNVRSLFGADPAQMRNIKQEVFDKGYIGKKYIEFNGKKVQLLNDDGTPTAALKSLQDYEANIINITPQEKEATKALTDSLDKTLWQLKKTAQGSSGTNIDLYNSLPKFNFKFVKDPETGLMKKVAIDGTNDNNYSRLLKKENLSDEEQLTLKVYHRMHALADPTLNREAKQLLFNDMRSNLFKRLSNEDYNSFPRDSYSYTRVMHKASTSGIGMRGTIISDGMKNSGFFTKYGDHFSIVPGGIGYTRDYGAYDDLLGKINDAYSELDNTSDEGKRKEIKQRITGYTGTLDRELSLVSDRGAISDFQDYYLSDLGSGDLLYKSGEGDKDITSPMAFSTVIKSGLDAYEGILESHYKSMDNEASMYKQIYSEGSGHEKLAAQIGLETGTKIPITIWREWDEETKQPTDVIHWSYTKTSTKDGRAVTTVVSDQNGDGAPLSQKTLFKEGIASFAGPSKNYDASLGADVVNPIELGSGVDEEVHFMNVRKYGGADKMAMSNENLYELMRVANRIDPSLTTEIRRLSKDFDSQRFTFKMIPSGGIWQYAAYKDGELFHKIPTEVNGRQKYTDEDVSNLIADSEKIINDIMYSYLYEMVHEAQLQSDIELTYAERQQILR